VEQSGADQNPFGEPILGSMARSERLARALAMGVPAFMRRARALEDALSSLHASLAAERARRLRPVEALLAARARGGFLPELKREVQAFNRDWIAYLEEVPLEPIHKAQEGYNRYYPIERELALPDAPPVPFKEVPLLDRADLLRRHPLLPEDP